MKYFALAILAVAIGASMPTQARAQIYFQGFETDTSGWFPSAGDSITRVPSGSSDPNYASGINAASGNFFARLGLDPTCTTGNTCQGPFTLWGSSPTSAGVPMPPSGSISELAIYLDVNFAGTHNDYRFDWDSALSDANGNFLQDYIFNAGTVPAGGDLCGLATAPHFTIAASFNSQRGSAFPQNPAFNPQCIAVSGWYTFRHTFLPDSQGNLEVDMDILNSSGATVASYVRHPLCMGTQAMDNLCTAGDPLPFSAVGFNAYGWHSDQEISGLAIDNTLLRPRQPNTKDDCKDGNWKLFTNPSFKNQGQCVSSTNHQNK
jgi:hypothetical protein